MNDVTKDLLEALREIVAEAQDFEKRTGQRVQGWPDKARTAIARAEAALATPAGASTQYDHMVQWVKDQDEKRKRVDLEQARIKERKEILDEIITKYLKCDCVLLTPKENECVKLIVKRIDADIRARN